MATASETSLTVPPSAFLIRLNSARSKVAQANSRRGPTPGGLIGTRGAGRSEVPGDLPEADQAVAGAARGVGGVAGGAGQPAAGAAQGGDDAGRGADARGAASDGVRCGRHGSLRGRRRGASRSTSKSSIPMSTAEIPSAIAWWVL